MSFTDNDLIYIGGFKVRPIQEIPTRTNTRVIVGATLDGRSVILKTALPSNSVGSGPQELQQQVHHMNILRQALGATSLFPPILYFNGTTLIQPYFSGGTLTALYHRNPSLFEVRFSEAINILFGGFGSLDRLAPEGFTFLHQQVSMRITRLNKILHTTNAGIHFKQSILTKHEGIQRMLKQIEIWVIEDVFLRLGRIFGPLKLSLAVHSDFVGDNVILGPNRVIEWPHNFVFIDPRGDVIWNNDLPWWDPIMDLGSFITFEEIIPPIEFKMGMRNDKGIVLSTHNTSKDWSILNYCKKLPVISDWSVKDVYWQERLEISIFIRLLGYISIAIAYGPPRGVLYAENIMLAFSEQFERIKTLI